MSYIDIKKLKANPKSVVTFTLDSACERQEKTYSGGTFTVWQYNVISDGQHMTLDAADSLKRKLDDYSIGDELSLSYEPFTKDDKLMYYWKLEAALRSEQKTEQVTKSINEFDEMLKKDKAAKQPFVNNGARFGMIFNKTFEWWLHDKCEWGPEQFVKNFITVENMVLKCENPKQNNVEQNNELKSIKKTIEETVEVPEDDLPF